MPTRDDWIWVAGFFDGEGSILLSSNGNNLQIVLAQKERPIMQEVHQLFGGYFFQDKTGLWRIYWVKHTSQAFLEGILPFLKVKDIEVKFALDWLKVDRSFPRIGKRITASHRQWRQEMAQRLQEYRHGESPVLSVSTPSEGLRILLFPLK